MFAQGTASLTFTQSFTASGVGLAVSNGPTTSGGPQGSVGFRMVYYIQPGSGTVSALSVEVDGSNLSAGSYTALTPAVGGGSGSGSTTNPATTFPQGQNNLCCDFYPFLQIKVNTLTVASGTPILIVKVSGYAGTSAAAGSGGGGGGITCLTGDVDAGSGSGCTSATVVGIDSVPLCSGFAPSNGLFLQYTTGSSPNPCYTAAAAGGGGGTGGTTGMTVYSGLAGVALSGTVFFPVGGGSAANATEATVETYQGTGGNVSGFGARLGSALGTGASVVLTWRNNGSNQSLSCTITNPATTCSDTGDTFSFASGDALDIQAVFTGSIIATPVWVMSAAVSSVSNTVGLVLLEEHSASTSAALNFTSCISSTYDDYEIRVVNVIAGTSTASILVQMSTNGGTSYDTGTNYAWASGNLIPSNISGDGSNAAAGMLIGAVQQTSASTTTFSGNYQMANPGSASAYKTLVGLSWSLDARNVGSFGTGGTWTNGAYLSTTAVNAFRIIPTTGNITSGTVRCYGYAK